MKKIPKYNSEDLFYTLALSYVKGIGSISIKKLLHHFESSKMIFNTSKKELLQVLDIGEYTVAQIIKEKKKVLELAEKEFQFALRNKLEILFYQDSNYPKHLKNCPDAPLILFSKGNYHLEHQKIISIVGTRNKTNYGKKFIQELIYNLKVYQPVIISGLALGCDAIAHQAALENELQTMGVLAHGLDQLYPSKHKKMAEQMLENGGLLTEFSSFHNPIREHFLKRNRIIAGMSQATLIVESAKKGGAMTTAKAAFDYNRDVLALPGNIHNPFSQGCNELIKNNIASLVTSAEDVVRLLNWEEKTSTKKNIQKQLFVHLEETEQRIYNYLYEYEKGTVDQLSLILQIPMPRLSVELLNMELKGVVRSLSGKTYELC
ncbi:protein smf [Flavobacteriaceae bacterium UJ101]|nr:protein smf [Flavobacteriaceae bacterium UJ101]